MRVVDSMGDRHTFSVELSWKPTAQDRDALLPALNGMHGFADGRIPFDASVTPEHLEATRRLKRATVDGEVRLLATVRFLPDGTFTLESVEGWERRS